MDEFEYNKYVIAARAMVYGDNNFVKSIIQSEELPPNFHVVHGNNLYIDENGPPSESPVWYSKSCICRSCSRDDVSVSCCNRPIETLV